MVIVRQKPQYDYGGAEDQSQAYQQFLFRYFMRFAVPI